MGRLSDLVRTSDGPHFELPAGKDARRTLMKVLSRHGAATLTFFAWKDLGWCETTAKGPNPAFMSSNDREETEPRVRMNVASRASWAETRLCVEMKGRA